MPEGYRSAPDSEGENSMSDTDDLPGRDTDRGRDEIPNPETGVGIGAREEPDTFEPEEDPGNNALG